MFNKGLKKIERTESVADLINMNFRHFLPIRPLQAVKMVGGNPSEAGDYDWKEMFKFFYWRDKI